MNTENDIHDRCNVSDKPSYIVFEYVVKRTLDGGSEAFWKTTCMTDNRENALQWSNSTADQNGRHVPTFVAAMPYAEALAIRRNKLTFSDAAVQIYRAPHHPQHRVHRVIDALDAHMEQEQ